MLETFQISKPTAIAGIFSVKDDIPPSSMVKSWLVWLKQNITKCSEVELLNFLREICPSLPESAVQSNYQEFVKRLF
ncbi:MAG: hypothetical protein DDT42_01955 [candidate division WS2 bacterium]|uniref:Uncharacterized protein n=1 Tax=Psychracetigena formicireducens TaxID=2986056 RepID=A0A9E2BJ92_PSYF1|nr:hypothetical protein [Candidatus Psychracetigena formicireducens]